ncbi:alpha/beta fold hydrolase [Halolamina sp.]|jgi:proline iminopeptidase|uniref:alpha/beta fold hydrolase n=1 Tax=Halolamina sp. TaxID=1940283 RepID=UPI000223B9B9|nr:alpha/beta hydrolase fold containing protein [halophilic archaeon DL31]
MSGDADDAGERRSEEMRLELNGAELHVETQGDPNDPAVLALHGGPGISDGRKSIRGFAPLADDHYLVAPDYRGCGRSELQPPYTNEQFAADVEALRAELGLGDVVLVGGSYGGFITQQYAVDYPEHLAGFVLRDTAATPEYDLEAREIARRRLPEVRERGIDVPHITAAELDRVMDGEVRSDEEFRRLFHGMLPLYAPSLDAFDAEAAADQIAELRFHHETHNAMFSDVFPEMDYTDDLPGVGAPALVTVGRHDWITPPAASEEIADLLPDARLEIFEESGHNPHFDQREAYMKRVDDFFAEIGY